MFLRVQWGCSSAVLLTLLMFFICFRARATNTTGSSPRAFLGDQLMAYAVRGLHVCV